VHRLWHSIGSINSEGKSDLLLGAAWHATTCRGKLILFYLPRPSGLRTLILNLLMSYSFQSTYGHDFTFEKRFLEHMNQITDITQVGITSCFVIYPERMSLSWKGYEVHIVVTQLRLRSIVIHLNSLSSAGWYYWWSGENLVGRWRYTTSLL